MVLDRRINELRLQSKDPLFNSIGWSYSSSPREGCSMNSFSISAQPKRWREALSLGMREASRLATWGVTPGEMKQAVVTLNNYFATQTAMKDSLESSTWMRRVMDTVSRGDQMMEAEAKQLLLKELSNGLTVEEVCERSAELFAPFLTLAEKGGLGGEFVGSSAFPVAKAFVCKPDEVISPNPIQSNEFQSSNPI